MAEAIGEYSDPYESLLSAEITDPNERLERLNKVFLDVSMAEPGQPLDPVTLRYLQHGDGIRLCLKEILDLRPESAEELHAAELREDYLNTLFIKARFLSKSERETYDEESDILQDAYTDTVVSRIAKVIDSRTPQEALELGQLPPVVRKASFEEGQSLTMDQFAGNHLYVLVDTALREHVARRQEIDERRTGNIWTRVASSRGTRVAIGATIGAASFVPELSFIPKPDEIISHDTEFGLRALSGVILLINLPEYIRLRRLDEKHGRETQEHYDHLSDSKEICDWALRIAYGSTRYGGSSPASAVTRRSGTDDKEENMRRLADLEKNFPHLNNDPGGKPYSARQVLGYAARLLLDRKEQLDGIIDSSKSADQQRYHFLNLCREILDEDLRRMKKGLNVTKTRRAIMGGIAVLPALVFSNQTSAVSEALTLSRDTAETIKPRDHQDADD